MKTFPQAVLDMIASGKIRFCHLMYIGFDSPLQLTDLQNDISYDGREYISSGQVLSVDDLVSSTEVRINELSIGFTMANNEIIAAVLSQTVLNRDVELLKAFLDEDNQIIFAYIMWSGQITGYSTSDSQDNPTLALNVASVWADFERVNSWRTTEASHHLRDASDDIFKYASKSKERIFWGQAH